MHDAFLNFYLIFWTCGTESQSQKQTCRVKQSLRIPNHASGEAACREKRGRKPDREESNYFSCLQSYHRPVNDLSTVVQLTNRLLRFWADGLFVTEESAVRLFSSRLDPYIITSWFAIALDEIKN